MLYKIETTSLMFPVIYVKAKTLDDCLYKARKHFESSDSVISNDLFGMIKSIHLISKELVE